MEKLLERLRGAMKVVEAEYPKVIGGNKAAATRLRVSLNDIRKTSQALRKELLPVVSER